MAATAEAVTTEQQASNDSEARKTVGSTGESRQENELAFDPVTQSLAPSKILPDGRFVYLPPPSARDRIRFFERSIARHGLLEEYLKEDEASEKEEEDSKKKEQQTVEEHPLKVASEKIRSYGISELNRAINLARLVSAGDYFTLSNIVDPSLESTTAAISASTSKSSSQPSSSSPSNANQEAVEGSTTTTATATVAGEAASDERATAAAAAAEQQQLHSKYRARYVLSRKRAQFIAAQSVLRRHKRRLTEAIVAQQQPDRRLLRLRTDWKLTAPEHGSRAAAHAVRPDETIACDVDVYSNNNDIMDEQMGRLARLVPRYATMELKNDYKVQSDVDQWERAHGFVSSDNGTDKLSSAKKDDAEERMDIDSEADKSTTEIPTTQKESPPSLEPTKRVVWTRAEPYAVADPALGNVVGDSLDSNVAMLTLRFDVEKPSTGFCRGACLEPISTVAVGADDSSNEQEQQQQSEDDEKVLVALQRSLFCAKLFESIRRELAPDTGQVGQVRASSTTQGSSTTWLLGESDENFLPPPSHLIHGSDSSGSCSLCVIHCHEGEVKVQLDSEYTLRVKLVEAVSGNETSDDDNSRPRSHHNRSGSESPSQLLLLCRTLLLHAQEVYHRHSMRQVEEEEKKKRNDASGAKTPVHPQKLDKSSSAASSPRILQSVVSLGGRILLERRVRKAFSRVSQWLRTRQQEQNATTSSNDDGINNSNSTNHQQILQVVWLPLSIFDFSSYCTVSFQSWSVNVLVEAEQVVVTGFDEKDRYSKAKFHSELELELFLRMALGRVLRGVSTM